MNRLRFLRPALVVLGLATACAAMAAPPAAAGAWRVRATHAIGGAGGWDLLAVDASTRRVFITRSDRLVVADVDSGKLLGEVGGLSRAHGVVLVPALGRGFVSSGGDDRVVAFDLATYQPLGDVHAGKNPDAMLYDAASGHVFAFNGRSNDVTVIDPKTLQVVATFGVPGKPELAVSDDKGRVFVNLEDKNSVAAIDARTHAVVATWPLQGCDEPSGLAIDAAHARLFSVCSNKRMVVLDAATGQGVASVVIGDEPDGAAFDAATGNVFSPNSDGTLTVVHEADPAHFRVVATVATPARSRTIALDDKTHDVILPTAQFDPAPAPTAQAPHPRPVIRPDTFGFAVVGTR